MHICLYLRKLGCYFTAYSRSELFQDNSFRDFILCKIVNGQHSAYNASKFKIMIERTRHQMLGKCYFKLYLAHKKSAKSDPVNIPYICIIINHRVTLRRLLFCEAYLVLEVTLCQIIQQLITDSWQKLKLSYKYFSIKVAYLVLFVSERIIAFTTRKG